MSFDIFFLYVSHVALKPVKIGSWKMLPSCGLPVFQTKILRYFSFSTLLYDYCTFQYNIYTISLKWQIISASMVIDWLKKLIFLLSSLEMSRNLPMNRHNLKQARRKILFYYLCTHQVWANLNRADGFVPKLGKVCFALRQPFYFRNFKNRFLKNAPKLWIIWVLT